MSGAVLTPLSATQQAVQDALDDRGRVSEQQAAFVRAAGDVFVRACPGAGKTRCVGLRLAYKTAFAPAASLAAVSHTNTAAEAIREAASGLAPLPDHFFVGTLHSFLLSYVVYPFGHVYMKCKESPEVIGEDRDWPQDIPTTFITPRNNCRVEPWRFDVDAQRNLTYRVPGRWPRDLTSEVIVKQKTEWAKDQKQQYWKRGLLSFSDVLYVAMRVLEVRADLRAAVAARFDELIVDEAQDTNDVQLRCLELLRQPDLRPGLVMVGDLDQAVYEWGRARPRDLLAAIEREQLDILPLAANYRSSRHICAITHRFSTRAKPDHADGRHAATDLVPEVWQLEPHDAVARFREHIAATRISEADAAVLVRTNTQAEDLNGTSYSDPFHWLLGILGRAALIRDTTGLDRETFDGLYRAVAYLAYGAGRPRGLTAEQRDLIHEHSASLIDALPAVSGTLREFNLGARDHLAAAAIAALQGAEPRHNARRVLADREDLAQLDATKQLSPPPAALARTIHDAKGLNIAAVLVIARPEDLDAWMTETWTGRPPDTTSEDTRVAYVALTRAERVLVVGTTPGTPREHLAMLKTIGFKVVG